MNKELPVQVGTNTVEYFGAVLVLFPLFRVEFQHGLIHQVRPTL